MKSLKLFLLIFCALATLALVILAWYLERLRAHPPLPVLGEVPDFALLDARMRDTSLADLRGKVWVADFIFTTCSGPCPDMTRRMAALHRSYQMEDGVRMVSVTVNPEYDSPAVLAAYGESHQADLDRWLFLTGARDAIHALAVQGFKMGSIEDPVFHSTRFVLVDRQARIRGYYEGTDEAALRRLFKDVARLLRERP
jgi:protein SCO1/2